MPGLKFKIFFILIALLFISFQVNAQTVCVVTPSRNADLHGTWVDKPRSFDGKSTYTFVVKYVRPTSCNSNGYFEATFTYDTLNAQNSVNKAKIRGVENGSWVSFDYTFTDGGDSKGSTAKKRVVRYWLQLTSDRYKANFVTWSNMDTKLVETWRQPLDRQVILAKPAR